MDTGHSPSPPALQFLESGIDEDMKPRCAVCGKLFKRMYALERHLLIHDPERAKLELKCPVEGCKFSSLQKSNVKTHIAAVHEKIKHTCTLPRAPEDTLNSGSSSYSERCGRIFSDVPALIRHEKRAHGYFRRGVPGRAKSKSFKVSTQSSGAAKPVESSQSEPDSRDRHQRQTSGSPSDEKVQYWLDGGDARHGADMEYESEGATPSVATFAHNEHYNSTLNYLSAPVSTAVSTPATTATSISDGESMTTSSTSSFISTSPSPAPPEPTPVNQYYQPPVSTYPPPYQQNYYYPYTSEPISTYDVNRGHSHPPAHFGQQQQPIGNVFYDTESLNPSMEEWLPQLAEMKAMQAGGMHGGQSEWDGIVTGLSLLD